MISRNSETESLWSSKVLANGSAKTVTASWNDTPCLIRFVITLRIPFKAQVHPPAPAVSHRPIPYPYGKAGGQGRAILISQNLPS